MKYSLILAMLLHVGLTPPNSFVPAQDAAAPQIAAKDDIENQDDVDLPINVADGTILDLKSFVRWSANVLEIKILDAGQLSGDRPNQNVSNKVEFYGTTKIKRSKLFEFLQGVLRSNGLAVVRDDVADWYRIVQLAGVRPFAPKGEAGDLRDGEYLTAVFSLDYISTTQAESYLKDLIYRGMKNDDFENSITTIASKNILIITETTKKLRTIADLIDEIDVPQEEKKNVFYKVKYLEASDLESQLTELLSDTQLGAASNADRNSQPTRASTTGLKIKSDLRTNRLILIGSQRNIDEALALIKELDIELSLKPVSYQLKHVSAKLINELVEQTLIGLDETAMKRVYQSRVNEQTNQLIVTARPEIHQRIEGLIRELDKESSTIESQSPIRFYTLKNVKAIDILETLQSVERRIREERRPENDRPDRLTGINTRTGRQVSNSEIGPINADGSRQFRPNPDIEPLRRELEQRQNDRTGGISPGGVNLGFDDFARYITDSDRVENILPGEAKITIDENSNTLIVVAEPAVQQLYADLIEKLDRRRPQVLIEVNVVTIGANDDFALGIEISGGDRKGDKKLYSFTSFGLSAVDAVTGALSIGEGGTGLNGTLVDPDVADVVLRALSSHGRARVVSAPRVLVNDNATGVLSSVAEVPFTSNNTNNTVSSTTFGGFAEAGTTINVTPQISDDNYLNLEFDVMINDFAAPPDPESGIPPPRNTNQVASQVSIPDGHTIIVGGLTRRSLTTTLDGLPIIEDLPVLNRIFSSESRGEADQRLFIFIKPTILRDDKFRDLRFVSGLNRNKACIPDDVPTSQPLLVR